MHWDGERNFLFQGLLRLPIPPLPFYLRRRCWISWDGERTRRRESRGEGRENEAEKKWVLVWPPPPPPSPELSGKDPADRRCSMKRIRSNHLSDRRSAADSAPIFGGSVAAAATVATTTADRDREWPSLSSPLGLRPPLLSSVPASPFPLEKIECSPSSPSKESLRGKKKQRPKRPISTRRDATRRRRKGKKEVRGLPARKGLFPSFPCIFFLSFRSWATIAFLFPPIEIRLKRARRPLWKCTGI